MNSNDAVSYAIARMGTGRVDRAGNPYIIHLAQVMAGTRMVLIEQGLDPNDDEAMQAAALHDTLEDTPTTPADLQEAGFSPRVIRLVQLLTRNEKQCYGEYLTNLLASEEPMAIAIKVADLRSNLDVSRDVSRSPSLKDMAKQDRYLIALELFGAEGPIEVAACMMSMSAADHLIESVEVAAESVRFATCATETAMEETGGELAPTIAMVRAEMQAIRERNQRLMNEARIERKTIAAAIEGAKKEARG